MAKVGRIHPPFAREQLLHQAAFLTFQDCKPGFQKDEFGLGQVH